MNDKNACLVEIDGGEYEVRQTEIEVREILELADMPAVGLVVRIHEGRATLCDPAEPIVLDGAERARFRTFQRDEVRHLRVGGTSWDWPAPGIRETEIRSIARMSPEQYLLSGVTRRPVAPGSLIDLTGAWLPHLHVVTSNDVRARSSDESARSIVVNGRSMLVDRPDVTFEDLVGLAFPGTDLTAGGARSLTVTYRHGPLDRPEGSLISRESLRVLPGATFNVTATNKS